MIENKIKMLTITEAGQYVPVYAIRRWIRDGDLRAVRTGRKYLIAEDVLFDFLRRGNCQSQTVEPSQQGKIRRL